MRTTLTLDDDVYEAAKTLADGSGEPLGAVVSELARRGLRPAPVAASGDREELPTFDVPADATLIPGSRAAELLAAEGAE
jgi:hypothetical protein